MGGAISGSYEKQRRQLRHALILETIGAESNADINANIKLLRALVCENHHLCATASRELDNKFDHSATTKEGAMRELERLYTLYEMGRLLRSAKMRKAAFACPLGHCGQEFTSHDDHPFCNKWNPPICRICDKKTKSGYYCAYCEYNICHMCSKVYCTYGHEMKIWTSGESDCACVVCKQHPIFSGYRCTICDDYDICDLCTYKDGRAAVAATIIERMEDNLGYMRNHVKESYTANKTISEINWQIGGSNSKFPTIWHLVQFSNELHDMRAVSVKEVVQSRITNEIHRLRHIITKHDCWDICMTAKRELAVSNKHSLPTKRTNDPFFTFIEASRMRALVDSHLLAKSVVVRNRGVVACPLGHICHKFDGVPSTYLCQAYENGRADTAKVVHPPCSVCYRLAVDGYHCSFCEYDLCSTCSVMWCSEGHEMTMWTILEAKEQSCYVCKKENLTQGYHCSKCFVNLCDFCTRKDKRFNVRHKWDAELEELMEFMHENRYKSDIARYFHWRNKSVVVSLGLLCDTVRAMRVSRYKAEKQVKFKVYIDKMKAIKADIGVNSDISATARREKENHSGHEGYFFRTKREAKAELERLEALVKQDIAARDVNMRFAAGIACPLGHAMSILKDISDIYRQMEVDKANKGALELRKVASVVSVVPPSHTLVEGVKVTEKEIARVREKERRKKEEEETAKKVRDEELGVSGVGGGMNVGDAFLDENESLNKEDEGIVWDMTKTINSAQMTQHGQVNLHYCDVNSRLCKICDKAPIEGHCCTICEYDLCKDCSRVFCRDGHEMQIWTELEAFQVTCSICNRQKLIMGYRCRTCEIDICDRCTQREVRQSMKLVPTREAKKTLAYLEAIAVDSQVAKECFEKYVGLLAMENSSLEISMSAVCSILKELKQAQSEAEHEIKEKKRVWDMHLYAQNLNDM